MGPLFGVFCTIFPSDDSFVHDLDGLQRARTTAPAHPLRADPHNDRPGFWSTSPHASLDGCIDVEVAQHGSDRAAVLLDDKRRVVCDVDDGYGPVEERTKLFGGYTAGDNIGTSGSRLVDEAAHDVELPLILKGSEEGSLCWCYVKCHRGRRRTATVSRSFTHPRRIVGATIVVERGFRSGTLQTVAGGSHLRRFVGTVPSRSPERPACVDLPPRRVTGLRNQVASGLALLRAGRPDRPLLPAAVGLSLDQLQPTLQVLLKPHRPRLLAASARFCAAMAAGGFH